MDFHTFAQYAERMEATSGNKVTDLCSDLFIECDSSSELFTTSDKSENIETEVYGSTDSLSITANFIRGEVFPDWSEAKLGIGNKLCYRALARSAKEDLTQEDIEDKIAQCGDIGEVASQLSYGEQKGLTSFGGNSSLTINGVYKELESISNTNGSGSTDEMIRLLFGLFNKCTPIEARYLSRIVTNEMRIGVGTGTVRDAIIDAFNVDKNLVERALQVTNDYGEVARTARDSGNDGLKEAKVTVGRPVKPMKAKKSTKEAAVDDWDKIAVDTKYDGARGQIHYDGENEVNIFTQKMENVTDSLPEVVEHITETIDTPVILDSEIVALDEDGNPKPFQQVLRRIRRKDNIEAMREEVPVTFCVFDCLYADGESLLDSPVTERYEIMKQYVDDEHSARQEIKNTLKELKEVEAKALSEGHEGIMLKKPTSKYTPGRRGKEWRKIKPDVETVDLTIVGAEWGEGRRANFMGSFLLGIYNQDNDEYEMVGKVATGITDNKLAELTELLKPYIVSEEGKNIDLQPKVVIEVGYEEIQESPTYNSGYALRFPRFLAVREDKGAKDAETKTRLKDLYEKQR